MRLSFTSAIMAYQLPSYGGAVARALNREYTLLLPISEIHSVQASKPETPVRHRTMALVLTTALWAIPLLPVANFADQLPALSQQDRGLVMAAVNIEMTEDQRPLFRDAVGQFIGDYRSGILKITRSNNAIDVDRRIENKRTRLLQGMDEQMSGFLSQTQFARYQHWRELMIAKLTQRAPSESDALMNLEMPIIPHH